MKEKAKTSGPRIGTLLFMLLWMTGHVGTWVLAVLVAILVTRIPVYFPDLVLPSILTALGTGLLAALWQKMLIQRGLGKSMRGWIPVSIIGAILAGPATNFMFYALWPLLGYADTVTRLLFVPMFLPVALIQAVWLHSRVKNAWLWAAAAAVGGILFLTPLLAPFFTTLVNTFGDSLGVTVLGVALSALLYSGVTGATMRYLWTQEREKSKNEAALTQSDEAERLERLRDLAGDDEALNDEQSERLQSSR